MTTTATPLPADEFYIVDVRKDWAWRPYLTLWRPNNAGYAYPTAWAGKYTRAQLEEGGTYYWKPRYASRRAMDRFPVRCAIVDALGVAPRSGDVDGNTGLVLLNVPKIRTALWKHATRPASVTDESIAQIRYPDRIPNRASARAA